MTPERDVYAAPESQSLPAAPALPGEQEAAAASLFQEINERRARIENSELLRHLRGL
jgi:hypothetical protein